MIMTMTASAFLVAMIVVIMVVMMIMPGHEGALQGLVWYNRLSYEDLFIHQGCMSMSAAPVTDDQAVELAEMFRILGDPSRLRVVLACLAAPICVSDIAAGTRLSPSLVSHHLRLLRATRILRAERQGKQVFYTTADDHVRCTITDMVAHVTEAGPSENEEVS